MNLLFSCQSIYFAFKNNSFQNVCINVEFLCWLKEKGIMGTTDPINKAAFVVSLSIHFVPTYPDKIEGGHPRHRAQDWGKLHSQGTYSM